MIFRTFVLSLATALPWIAAILPTVASQTPLVALIDHSSKAVFMVEAFDARGNMRRGAAFLERGSHKIVTAFHVVRGASIIRVIAKDGREATATISAMDGYYDIALLGADTISGDESLEIEAANPEVGASVIAIGFPFGHAFSASAGIVSGLDRTYDVMSPHGFLQHDAALNPGSSGGPVIDMLGRVVGMNVAIPNGRRSDVGVGFAVPGAVLADVVKKLVRDGSISHGHIGARLRFIDTSLAFALGRKTGGALVEDLEAEGPASRAGIRIGDLISEIDGVPIDAPRRLSEAVIGASEGKVLYVTLRREGFDQTYPVKVGALRDPNDSAGAAELEAATVETGIEFAPGSSATISGVGANTMAQRFGLRAGDVVLAVGIDPVANADDVLRAFAKARRDGIALLIYRKDMGSRYVILSDGVSGPLNSPFNGNREADGSASF